MIDKMPLVNIKHNKKNIFGEENLLRSKSGKIWVFKLDIYFRKILKHFSDLPKICPEIFPPDFPIQKFLPYTFYRGSKRCYSPNQNREKKCTNLQNNSSHWCFWFDEKFLVQEKLLRLFFGWYFAELKIFHGKFNLKKRKTSYKYMSRSGFQFSFNWFPGIFARIWKLPELPEVGKMEGGWK